MSEYIHKSHNVTVLIYHLVFPAKYRRAVFDDHVDDVLKEVCLDIEKRYQLNRWLQHQSCIELGGGASSLRTMPDIVMVYRGRNHRIKV